MGLRFNIGAKRFDEAARKGLGLAAEHLLGVTQNRVPLEEGSLMRTGRVTEGHTGRQHVFGVVYGGQGLRDYAQRQHEELTWRHASGRTAKYVEGPLYEEAETLKAIIGAHIRRKLK